MPDTVNYMILGYGMGLSVVGLTFLSLWWRWRSLKADEATLEQLKIDIQKDQADR